MPKIETQNPCLLVFVVDQSYSMSETIGGSDLAKMHALTSAVNKYLYKIARFKCREEASDGSYIIRPRFHISLIGYSDDRVYSAFEGSLATRSTVPLDELAASPVEITQQIVVEDGVEEKSIFPVWLRAKAEGNTPMHSALQHADNIVKAWLPQWPNLTAPAIVLNVTDGKYTSGPDPTLAARALTGIRVADQHVLLFNLHLSGESGNEIFCPDSLPRQSDEWAQLLFSMSSELTPQMRTLAREKGYDVADHARGFAFNADFEKIFDFLDIGTEVLSRNGQLALSAGRD